MTTLLGEAAVFALGYELAQFPSHAKPPHPPPFSLSSSLPVCPSSPTGANPPYHSTSVPRSSLLGSQGPLGPYCTPGRGRMKPPLPPQTASRSTPPTSLFLLETLVKMVTFGIQVSRMHHTLKVPTSTTSLSNTTSRACLRQGTCAHHPQ